METKQYCCETISMFSVIKIVYYNNIESALESITKSLNMDFNIEGNIYRVEDQIDPILTFKKAKLP